MTKKALDKVAFDKIIMKRTAIQLKSNFLTLRRKRIAVSPGKLILLCYVSINILVLILMYVYKNSFGKMFMYQHAMKAKSEMEVLHREIYKSRGIEMKNLDVSVFI
ncbi:MAG: hypothetical protein ACERKN_22325 [Velocimicrobium sp.]